MTRTLRQHRCPHYVPTKTQVRQVNRAKEHTRRPEPDLTPAPYPRLNLSPEPPPKQRDQRETPTPTYVEESRSPPGTCSPRSAHPHVRREKSRSSRHSREFCGSPPCVGKSPISTMSRLSTSVHLRARRERRSRSSSRLSTTGSPLGGEGEMRLGALDTRHGSPLGTGNSPRRSRSSVSRRFTPM